MEIAFKKPKIETGSVLWLALNQFRRSFRLRGAKFGAKQIIGNFFLISFIILVFWGVGQGLFQTLSKPDLNINVVYYAAGKQTLIAFIALSLMSMMTSFMYLTDRGDLDLLLSAPIDAKNIIIARLLVGSWRTIIMFWFFGSMFIGVSAVLISPKYFTYIPISMGLALLEAGITFVAARIFLLKFGLKKGRTLVQIIGFAGIFGGVFLKQMEISKTQKSEIQNQYFQEFFEFIGRALLGDWWGALLILAIGTISFYLITILVGKNFGNDAAWLAGQSELGIIKNRKNLNIKFKPTFKQIFFSKEMKSILRDPTAIVQFVAPLAGLLPLIITIMSMEEKESELIGYVTSPLIVFLSASMSASLAWMIISVEEADELLRSSPRKINNIYLYKALCALIPGGIEFIIFSILIAYFNPIAALNAFVFSLLANISVIALELANPKPSKRPKMMQKPDRSFITIMIGILIILLWSIAAAVAFYSLLWSLIPIILVLIILAWSVLFKENEQTNHVKNIWARKTAN